MYEVEKLTRENRQLNQILKQKEFEIQKMANEKAMYAQLGLKWKKEKQYLHQQIKQLRRREEDYRLQRQEIENRYTHVLTKLEDELEQRKQKYEKLESKIEPLFDHDTVRLKILNEVQNIHFLEIEEIKRKNNQLKDEMLRLRRENELLKHQVQTLKIQHQDQIRRIKNSYEQQNKSQHLNELTFQMCMQIENRLKSNYDQARKQAEYYRDKYFTSEKKAQERIAALEKEIGKLSK